MPENPGQRTSLTPGWSRRNALTAMPFSACAAMRRCSVRSPRCTRKQSSGPGTAPTESCVKRTASCSAGSATTTAPPTVSEWPPRYLVVECTAAPAPHSSGRWLTGVANVLSTATSTSDPTSSITAGRSITLSVGFVGVSTQTSFVSGRTRGADRVDVALVDHVVGDAEARQDLVDQAVRAAVQVVGDDHVVPGAAHRGEQRVRGRHAGRERRGVAALQLSERVLQRPARRVGGARVVVVLDELARRRLHVRRALMDGGDDRAVARDRDRVRRGRSAWRARS